MNVLGGKKYGPFAMYVNAFDIDVAVKFVAKEVFFFSYKANTVAKEEAKRKKIVFFCHI